MTHDTVHVDVTVGAHNWLDALATCSFKLACGCTTRMTPPEQASEAHLIRGAGMTYPCTTHGEQIITRMTQRLTGWLDAPPDRWRPPQD